MFLLKGKAIKRGGGLCVFVIATFFGRSRKESQKYDKRRSLRRKNAYGPQKTWGSDGSHGPMPLRIRYIQIQELTQLEVVRFGHILPHLRSLKDERKTDLQIDNLK